MDMRAAAETTFMDDGLSPDRSLEYSLHKKRFSFKRKEASNALFKKPQVQPSEFTCAITEKKLSTLERCLNQSSLRLLLKDCGVSAAGTASFKDWSLF